jgi:hypothetical protein
MIHHLLLPSFPEGTMNYRIGLFPVLVCLLMLLFALHAAAQKPAAQKPAAPAKPNSAAGVEKSKDAADKSASKESESEAVPDNKQKGELSPLQQRALLLLDQSATESVALSDKWMIARLQSAAADALWEHQPERARELFRNAFDAALAHYRDTGDTNQIRVTRSSYLHKQDQRLEILRLAGRRDAELGQTLTEEYIRERQREQEEKKQKTASSMRNSDNRVFGDVGGTDLIQVADSLLSVDPKSATEVAQRSIDVGIATGFASFLFQLSTKDRRQSDALYLMALERLLRDPFPHAGQLMILMPYAFAQRNFSSSNGDSSSMFGFNLPQGFTASDQLVQRYLGTAFTVLNRNAELAAGQIEDAANRYHVALYAALYLTPQVEKYQPNLLADWQGVTARLTQLASEQARSRIPAQVKRRFEETAPTQKSNEDRLQSLLGEAETATDPKVRASKLFQAAMQASEDTEKALEIADKIPDLTDRRKVRSWISFSAADKLAGENKLEEARRYALNVDEADQRAWLFQKIARKQLETDRPAAERTLQEAMKHATDAENNPAKVRALIGIASAYALFDLEHAFETSSTIVRTLSRLKEPLSDSGKLVRSIEAGGFSSINTTDAKETELISLMTLLGQRDPQRALLQAQLVEDSQTKLSMIIAISTSMLSAQKDK